MTKTGKKNVSPIKGTRKKNINLDVNDIPENIKQYLKYTNTQGRIPLSSITRALTFNRTRIEPIIPKTNIKDFTLDEFIILYNAFKQENSQSRRDNRTKKRAHKKIYNLDDEIDEPDELDEYLKSIRNYRSSLRRKKSIAKKSNKAQKNINKKNDDDIDADTANILQDLKDEDLMNQSLLSSPAPSKMNTHISPIPPGIFRSPRKNRKLKIEPPMNLQGTNLFQGHQIESAPQHDYGFFDFMNYDDLPKTPK